MKTAYHWGSWIARAGKEGGEGSGGGEGRGGEQRRGVGGEVHTIVNINVNCG